MHSLSKQTDVLKVEMNEHNFFPQFCFRVVFKQFLLFNPNSLKSFASRDEYFVRSFNFPYESVTNVFGMGKYAEVSQNCADLSIFLRNFETVHFSIMASIVMAL